ncbi:NADPH-dependent F420 reductase [Leifsonia shinshuensis]
MNIAAFGTGVVGRTLAARLSELGHTVTIGTRDPEATLARPEPDRMSGETFAAWAQRHPGVGVATFADAAAGADVILNATNGGASLDVLALAGAANLAGKVIVDIANPLDFSKGMPPTLFVKDTDSLAEQLQRAYPDAHVVKALNTLNAGLMADPSALSDPGTLFIAGDDADAKAVTTGLLRELGHTDIIDLGDLTAARGTEMLLPIWLRLMGTLGTAAFNFKIVR